MYSQCKFFQNTYIIPPPHPTYENLPQLPTADILAFPPGAADGGLALLPQDLVLMFLASTNPLFKEDLQPRKLKV